MEIDSFLFLSHLKFESYFFVPDVPVYVCNNVRFGYILSPLEDTQTIEDDYAQLVNVRIEASGIDCSFLTFSFECL